MSRFEKFNNEYMKLRKYMPAKVAYRIAASRCNDYK